MGAGLAAPTYATSPATPGTGQPGVQGIGPVVGPRGGMGRLGPVDGPLSVSLPGGEIGGPQWRGAPLPAVGARAAGSLPLTGDTPSTDTPSPSGPTTNVVSSELPDARTLELSRLANPEMQVRPQAPKPAAAPQASQNAPLRMSMVVSRPSRGVSVGDFIPVRVSATTDCYLALLRVDTDGKATTAFRSPGASQSFTCAVKAGPGTGPIYLVAVGSTHPLSGAEAVAALRNQGGGFPTLTTAAGGTDGSTAWSAVLAQAGSLGGTPRPWQRYEWAVSTGSFLVPPPRQLTSVPPTTRQALPKGISKSEPASEGSTLPTPEPANQKPRPATAAPSSEPSLLPSDKSQAEPATDSPRSMLPPTTR